MHVCFIIIHATASLSEKKCADTEFRYGDIVGKHVIYRGESKLVGQIKYLNVEEYLKAL